MSATEIFLARAEDELRAKRPDQALSALEAGLETHPDDPELHARYGLMLCWTQRELDALEHLERAKGAPSHAELAQVLVDHLHCRKAMARKLGLRDDAGERSLRILKKATGLKPGRVGITLSACLIVKNEEKNLDRCLRSLQGLADEIVVVDTGSTDRTVEIAARYGAKIGHFEWIDDFSAARNASLALATKHWVLWIDADEEVDPAGIPMIREALMRPHFGGYYVQIDNRLGEEGSANSYVHSPIRLFQRLPGVEFTLRIHEQVLPSLERLGLTTTTVEGARLLHYGYTSQAMSEKSKLDRTLGMLGREIEESPQEPFHWFNLANALVVGARWQEAAEAARRAVELMSDDAVYGSLTYHLLATALCESDRPDMALVACAEADARGFGGILVEYERLHALGLLGRFDEALVSADRCLSMDWPLGLNGDYGIYTHKRHVLAAQVLAQVGRHGEALELFEHALSVDPDMTVAVYGRAVTLLRLDRFEKAIDEFSRCIEDPIYGARSERGLAECLLRLGRHRDASGILERQWHAGLRDENLFTLWAQACEGTGDSAALLSAFDAFGREGEPTSAMLINWGRTLQATGDHPRALACYSEAIKRAPDDPNAYLNCGDMLYVLGQFGDAAHLYESALRLQPDNPQAWFVLGNCLYQLGLQPGARLAWEQTLRAAPGHPGAMNNLSLIVQPSAA